MHVNCISEEYIFHLLADLLFMRQACQPRLQIWHEQSKCTNNLPDCIADAYRSQHQLV